LRVMLTYPTQCVMHDLHTMVVADIKRPVTATVFESVIASLVAEGMIVQATDGLVALR